MKWLRFDDGNGPAYGRLNGDGTTIEVVEGTPWGIHRESGRRAELSRVQLLAPVDVHHVYGVGLNYVNHIKEVGAKTPKIPLLFMKPNSAVVGPDKAVIYPREGQDVHYECELAVVIGKRARRVSVTDALGLVLGYTCANDISERVIQREEMGMGSLVVSKGYDTFCPLGPFIVSGLDPSNLRIQTRINGKVRQDSNTSDLLFDVPTLIAYLSQSITLEPGDVILTGTPAGIGPVLPGDVMEIDIEGIGILRNPVVAEDGAKTQSRPSN